MWIKNAETSLLKFKPKKKSYTLHLGNKEYAHGESIEELEKYAKTMFEKEDAWIIKTKKKKAAT